MTKVSSMCYAIYNKLEETCSEPHRIPCPGGALFCYNSVMKIHVLDGAGSANRTSGIIDHTVERLKKQLDISEAKWINYPAAMMGVGGDQTWEESSREGVRLLMEEMLSHTEDVILLSYSAGNKPLHDFLEMFPEFHGRIKAVGFMSDPWRPRDRFQSGTPRPIGWGIKGERVGPLGNRSFWTSVYNDAISAAYPDALIRYMADVTEGAPDEIIIKAINLGKLSDFQLSWQIGIIQRNPIAWFVGLGGRIGQLSADVRGYLTGAHTNDYIKPFKTPDGKTDSLAVRLADTIAWKVKKDMGLV